MQDQHDPVEKFAPEEIQELIKTLDEKKPLSPYQILIYANCLKGNTAMLKEPSCDKYVQTTKVIEGGRVLYQGLAQRLIPAPEDLEVLREPEGWNFLRGLMGNKPEEGNFYTAAQKLCISRIDELKYWEGEESRVFNYGEHIQSLENTVLVMHGEPIEEEVQTDA